LQAEFTATAMTKIAYRTVEIDGLNIFYREAGPFDGPALLLLHGLPSSSRMYEPLLHSDLAEKYRLVAPDYPGFGHSSWPDHRKYPYTFDRLAEVMQSLATRLGLDRYSLFMQDYGGPVGFRMAMAHPEKISAMIIQNANAYEEGLSPLWKPRLAFFRDRAMHESEVRANLLSLEATRRRHLGSDPNTTRYNPDLWVDEYYFLNQPGQADIQLDLFHDYRTNIEAYPRWQQWLRDNQPPLLVIWGKYDPSFTIAGAEAYKCDVPNTEVHIVDAGHFAMDLDARPVERLAQSFLDKLNIVS
jgi:pimeloyl-ACP methyl ester carboxylesterase